MKIRRTGAVAFLLLMRAFFLSNAFGQESTRSAIKQEPGAESEYSEMTKAPEKARAKRNPFEKDPEAVVAGRILFEQRCAECHGDNAEGGKKGPSLSVGSSSASLSPLVPCRQKESSRQPTHLSRLALRIRLRSLIEDHR